MEKAIFPEPGSPILFDAKRQPANAWHMHEAPEWEKQCQEWSLFELVSPGATEIAHWRCCEWCKCAWPGDCGYIETTCP